MAKKEVEIEEKKEVPKDEPVVEKGMEEKVEKEVEKQEKKILKATGERVDIMEVEPKPRPEDPDFNLKSWAKALDEKVDILIGKHKEKDVKSEPLTEIKKEEPKKVSIWDRELF